MTEGQGLPGGWRPPGQDQTWAIRPGCVLLPGGVLARDREVVIRDGLVEEVVPSGRTSATGIPVLDVPGASLLPGLIPLLGPRDAARLQTWARVQGDWPFGLDAVLRSCRLLSSSDANPGLAGAKTRRKA